MAASVLNSPPAVQMSVYVVRAFVRLRQLLSSHADLARKLDALENKYDTQFKAVFAAIHQLMTPPSKPRAKSAATPNHDPLPAEVMSRRDPQP
jgi:hypothetical protein